MDGITFLRKIMAERPTPVVMCSTLTPKGAETTMQALAAGAVAILTKPKIGIKAFLLDAASDLLQVVKSAARANVRNLIPGGVATPVRVIMTGMGDDGARGLHDMHQAGARTLGQDERSCVVFGMPKEAIRLGGVDKVLPLQAISAEIGGFAAG